MPPIIYNRTLLYAQYTSPKIGDRMVLIVFSSQDLVTLSDLSPITTNSLLGTGKQGVQ